MVRRTVYQGRTVAIHGETVYIRDSGEELFVYQMESDEVGREQGRIQAIFTLICKLKKVKTKWRYGKKIAH